MTGSCIIVPPLCRGAGAFHPEGGGGRLQVAGDAGAGEAGTALGSVTEAEGRQQRFCFFFFLMCLFIGAQMVSESLPRQLVSGGKW